MLAIRAFVTIGVVVFLIWCECRKARVNNNQSRTASATTCRSGRSPRLYVANATQQASGRPTQQLRTSHGVREQMRKRPAGWLRQAQMLANAQQRASARTLKLAAAVLLQHMTQTGS